MMNNCDTEQTKNKTHEKRRKLFQTTDLVLYVLSLFVINKNEFIYICVFIYCFESYVRVFYKFKNV